MKKLINKLFAKQHTSSDPIPMPAAGMPSVTLKKKRRNPIGFIIVLAFIVGGIMAGQYLLSNRSGINGSVAGVTSPVSQKNIVEVNQNFSFAPYNAAKKISDKKVTFSITNVEKTTEIIIKGKRATAVAGRAFLVVNLKITNDHGESLYLNTRNFVRIKPGNSEDKLAPDIHNDTVEVQPNSTKITRVGVPVDSDVADFVLYVGEIEDKEKTEIPISFQ